MRRSKDVSHMLGHAYFRNSEARHEAGTGLELALQEMAASKRKTEALRAARARAEKDTRSSDHNL